MLNKAKEGDTFITKSGSSAIYKSLECEGVHILSVEGLDYYYTDDGKVFDLFPSLYQNNSLDLI